MTSPVFDVEGQRAILRQGTLNYIAMDPTTITLIPVVRTPQDDGSWVEEDGTPREPQDFKLISIEFTPQAQTVTLTQDGKERIIGFYLMGAYDCIMQPKDHWIGADGRTYTVIALMDGHGYETKGAVEAHG
jgi:hypothetical protein